MSLGNNEFLYSLTLLAAGVTVRFLVGGTDRETGLRVIVGLVIAMLSVLALHRLIGPQLAEPTVLFKLTGDISIPKVHEIREFLLGFPIPLIAGLLIIGPSFLRNMRDGIGKLAGRKAQP